MTQGIDDSSFQKFFLTALAESDKPVEAQIVTNDSAVKEYWPVVMEFGSREGSLPWPHARKKTVRYKGRIYSRQDPGGVISKNRPMFLQYLREEFLTLFKQLKRPLRKQELVTCANRAAQRVLDFLQSVTPEDTGRLKNSLKVRKAK